jgi:hypothetical protein
MTEKRGRGRPPSLRDMRRYTSAPHRGDKIGRVIRLVRTQRDAMAIADHFDHRFGGLAFGVPSRLPIDIAATGIWSNA